MNALLAIVSLGLFLTIAIFVPTYGAPAIAVCAACAVVAGLAIFRVERDREFLLQIFVAALLVRVLLGTLIFMSGLQEFFGGDANAYDEYGYALLRLWQGELAFKQLIDNFSTGGGWGMIYIIAAVYGLVGRNMLAIQFVNAVIGAATVPVIFLCARHIFQNSRVARLSAFFVAFYPSLVLWSSQGLKDGPIIFFLALAMLATLRLGEKLNATQFLALVCALFGIFSFRFYVFYMVIAAIAGAFVVGMRPITAQSLARQLTIIVCLGLAITYLGVVRRAGGQLETFGNLERVQQSRANMSQTANTGFGADIDVLTTSGALTVIPIGMTYLLFAPFPWQLANLRQTITLPEMIVWWGSFPLLIIGLWFTLRFRLRQALPILIFTSMLTSVCIG